MADIIYLICCGVMGVMCHLCDINMTSLEYWIMVTLVIVPYYCGKYDKGGK
jgi:hypothetical protein